MGFGLMKWPKLSKISSHLQASYSAIANFIKFDRPFFKFATGIGVNKSMKFGSFGCLCAPLVVNQNSSCAFSIVASQLLGNKRFQLSLKGGMNG